MSRLAALAFALAASSAYAQDPQTGARAKALAGAGTAFEDDPHSLWMNPAGIATQPGGVAASYQTYPFYVEHGDPVHQAQPRPKINDPVFVPSFLGAVLQVGSATVPQAVGVCVATPYHLHFPYVGAPAETVVTDQQFHRLRFSYAIDFRLRPAGDEGFLNRATIGIGADLALTRFEFTRAPADENPSDESDFAATGGVGLLLGLFENGRDWRAALGIAYQGPASFDLGDNLAGTSGDVPFFDWPQQLQVGLALYLLDRLPLRVCIEAQWTDWKGAAEKSARPGIDSFESSLTFAAAGEYRIELAPTVGLVPRAGVRFTDAPWKDASKPELPAAGNYQLLINTRDEAFVIVSFGFGLSWGYKEGTQDTLDAAFEVGGDTIGFAMSYTFQF